MHSSPQSGNFKSLEGKLLVADNGLRDENFFRCVILLASHTPQGAQGYVLNQPLDRQVDQLLDGEAFKFLGDVPVFKGGPVAAERLTFATLGWDSRAHKFSFQSHLSTTDAQSAHLAGKDVRAFVGHSGWVAGQLEKELQSHAWIVQDAVPDLADPEAIPSLWSRVLHGMGPFFAILALTPAKPELN